MDIRVQKIVFAGTSRLTDVAPALGGRLLDATLRPALGSRDGTIRRDESVSGRPDARAVLATLPVLED